MRSRLTDGAAARRAGLSVFAVEDTCVQLHWSGLPVRRASIEVGGRVFEVDGTPPDWYRRRARRRLPEHLGGPGALVVEDLEPDTTYEVRIEGRTVATARTLPALPGVLTRFATVSDCHIGEAQIGLLHGIRDPRRRPPGLDPYPVRSLAAALREAEQWGAALILAKGDLTYDTDPDDAEEAARLLSAPGVPVEALLGNHDVRGKGEVEQALLARRVGYADGVHWTDLPGVRLIFGHSPVRGLHAGRLSAGHLDALVEAARSTDHPVVVCLHHPPSRFPVPTYYPPPISWRDSEQLMKGLAAANRRTLLLAGHTHRNRRYRVHGVDVVEVGSTKDYPGGWAGYTVFEGGIRQTVRRTTDPAVIAWTETTSRALGGLWGCWSPGYLEDRCWTLRW